MFYYIEGAKSTAGTSGAVTQSGAGPLITLANAPNDDHEAIVQMVLGGAVGTATFRYSLDGGISYSPTYVTAGTFDLPSGVEVSFTAGTYVAGETYTWTDTGPRNTNADISAAFDVMLASSLRGQAVYVVGSAANAADTETIATTVHSRLDAAVASQIYMRGFVEAPAIDKANLIAEFADFEGARVAVFAGYCDVASDVNHGRFDKRSCAMPLAARIMRNGISVQSVQNETESGIEPLAGVRLPDNQAAATGYNVESQTPGLKGARFCTLDKYPPRGGVFASSMQLMTSLTSDFKRLEYGLIIDEACRVIADALLDFQGRKLRIDAATGFLREDEARSIEAFLRSKLFTALVETGDTVDWSVAVATTDNLLASNTLRIAIRGVPFPYADEIRAEIGFRNPANLEAA